VKGSTPSSCETAAVPAAVGETRSLPLITASAVARARASSTSLDERAAGLGAAAADMTGDHRAP